MAGSPTRRRSIPAKTTQVSGFSRGTTDGPTTDTQAAITPNGKVDGWCKSS
jgi:hypothetical protein